MGNIEGHWNDLSCSNEAEKSRAVDGYDFSLLRFRCTCKAIFHQLFLSKKVIQGTEKFAGQMHWFMNSYSINHYTSPLFATLNLLYPAISRLINQMTTIHPPSAKTGAFFDGLKCQLNRGQRQHERPNDHNAHNRTIHRFTAASTSHNNAKCHTERVLCTTACFKTGCTSE